MALSCSSFLIDVDQFVITDIKIGSGLSASVFRAYSKHDNFLYAAKIIKSRQTFLHEKYALRLSEQNKVKNFTKLKFAGPFGTSYVLGFDFYPFTLTNRLFDFYWLSPCKLERIIFQLFEAVGGLNRFGWGHFDIKPDNIFLDKDDNAYLGDFGLATKIDWFETRSENKGTANYNSYEMLNSRMRLANDSWSLGVVLYEILTKTPILEAYTTDVFHTQKVTEHELISRFRKQFWMQLRSGVNFKEIVEAFMLTEKEEIEPVNVIFDSLLEPRRNELLRSCEK